MLNDSNLTAILGPTNTGKTFLAFDRLISYKSGIFGFPLRLLARENYDKAVDRLGSLKVALITGEEKILPKDARYFFCTVESMPLNVEVECIAIDEVQLAADYERGHIFTDRILNLRGVYETILLGSTTIEKILIKLFPKISIKKRDRFSKLSFESKNSLSKLNPRTAIIAFNINSVYEIAESLRMHKGGAAVVLGSLSPRTRNAQVEVYEDKKVDYLVATDAIGMGLNLNINHVAFSAVQKFDGRYNRNLSPAEMGQIAGRAGRYQNDGTFSFLKDIKKIDPLIIQSIENHSFQHVSKIYWRNSNIDFTSVSSVLDSFKQFPIKDFFIHKKNAEDELNFRVLINDSLIIPYLQDSQKIILLWDICRIPDFQKIFNDSYIGMLKNIFLTLMKNNNILPENWLQDNILRLENYSGGIDELSSKISNIRTWTYISNQSDWIANHQFWQEKTKKIENNLSDFLHKSLTNRFIDLSASYFLDLKNRGDEVVIDVDKKRALKLNGKSYGYINGFSLELIISNTESLFSLKHVKKSIRIMIEEKINNFLSAPLDSINFGEIKNFNIKDSVKIYWGEEPIGKLMKGENIFTPKAVALETEFLASDKKILISNKLQDWLDKKILNDLTPIEKKIDETITSEIRAILFNVYNFLGTMLINDNNAIIKRISQDDKIFISKLGLRVGAKFFFIPNLLKKTPIELKALLWKTFYEFNQDGSYPLPNDGRVSFTSKLKMPNSYWLAIGYHNIDNFAVRVDVFEKIFFLARKKFKYGPFIESSEMMNPIGCNSDQLKKILEFCGFESILFSDEKKLYYMKSKKLQKNLKKNIISNKKVIKIKKNKDKKNIIIHKGNKNIIINKDKKNIIINKDTKNFNKEKKMEINKKNPIDPNSPFAVLEKLL